MSFDILVLFALPDAPAMAWFFNAGEKKAAVLSTARDQTGWTNGQMDKWPAINFSRAQSITDAGITNFSPLTISGCGFSQAKTVLMATPQAAVALVARTSLPHSTCGPSHDPPHAWQFPFRKDKPPTSIVLDNTTDRTASLCFYNVSWVLMLSLISSNTSSMTKKSFVSVSAAVFYAIGNTIGPQLFGKSQSPEYQLSIGAILCFFAIVAAIRIL
ncbi:hypothetical protein BJ878DRAFT_541812 [Calycina marina]|uniref:Uncharacterized protein n=1 Tax=Calycina marina TaxID=1763456 RepID=A0A9P7Z420_9HELO|nr:hypothetical protein BJ878DRAFT_541812 [Calycina marina]